MAPVIGTLWNKASRLSPRARYGIWLVCILVVLYSLLQNGHWTPGADSEVYLAAARNLLAGRGYEFNRTPLAHYPPGWPLFLAGMMAISPSFWFLNAVAKVLLLLAALLFYFTLTRYTTPRRAFICVVLSATLWHWFRYGYVLMSESLFFFLAAAGLLIAVRVKEGHTDLAHLGLLAVVCVILPLVRWIGVALAGAMALTAASGEFWPRLCRKHLALALVCALSLCSFGSTYHLVCSRASTPIVPVQPAAGKRRASDIVRRRTRMMRADVAKPKTRMIRADVAKRKTRMIRATILLRKRHIQWYLNQAAQFGTWLSRLFWPAAKLGRTYGAVNMLFNLVGLILFVPYLLFTWERLKAKDWLWLGLLLYLACLAATVAPRGRYLAPVAPPLLLAIWAGGEDVCRKIEGWLKTSGLRRTVRALPAAFLAFLFLCNMGVYTVAAYVQRSPDFYGTFWAGQYQELVDAAYYISRRAPADATIAVSLQRKGLARVKTSLGSMAALALLTDRYVVPAPAINWTNDNAYLDLLEWAPTAGVSYLLIRPPTSPWCLWHFRVPFLQRLVTGQTNIEHNPFWLCFQVTQSGPVRIVPPHIEGFPSEVPAVVDRTPVLDTRASIGARLKERSSAENASDLGRTR